jgi:hypothetical protein
MDKKGAWPMTRSFTNFANCHSGSRLDEFCARLFDFKRDGTYVDIGSAHSKEHNNSNYLDVRLGWRGLCVDIDHNNEFGNSYADRKNCLFLKEDATKIDYAAIFEKMSMPLSIDYLSIDVDVLSLAVAEILPLDKYRFKIIGIEHDSCLHGDMYRIPQRELLLSKGYILVCADIFVRIPDFENKPFEDWYLDPQHFSSEVIEKVKSSSCYPEDVIVKLGGTERP